MLFRSGSLKREITQIGWLHDVSVVSLAAYPATSVANREQIDIEAIKRSLDEADAEEIRKAEELRKEEIQAKLNEKLSNFYKNIS